ncbi:hypothetical protein FH022_15140 [Listeria monocytogenes]|nr:hypothetical protein [Listeria monocytogenes]
MRYKDICFLIEHPVKRETQNIWYKLLLPVIGTSILYLIYSIGSTIALSKTESIFILVIFNIIYLIALIVFILNWNKQKSIEIFTVIVQTLLIVLFFTYNVSNMESGLAVLVLCLTIVFLCIFLLIQKNMISKKLYGITYFRGAKYKLMSRLTIGVCFLYSIIIVYSIFSVYKGAITETVVQSVQVISSALFIFVATMKLFFVPDKLSFSNNDVETVRADICKRFPRYYSVNEILPKWQIGIGLALLYIPLLICNYAVLIVTCFNVQF